MASVSTYLNFTRDCEAAFKAYRTIFGTDFVTPINRFGDIPPQPGCAPASDADKQLVMHVALPILGGHVLMGSDCSDSIGMKLNAGNNVFIGLAPDTRAETERLFNALALGGSADKVTLVLPGANRVERDAAHIPSVNEKGLALLQGLESTG